MSTDPNDYTVERLLNTTPNDVIVTLAPGQIASQIFACGWGIFGLAGNAGILAALAKYSKSPTPHDIIMAHITTGYFFFCFAKWYRFVQNFAAGFKWVGGSETAYSCWVSAIIISVSTGGFMCFVPHLATERWGVVCRGWTDHHLETKITMWSIWAFSVLYTVLFCYNPKWMFINESGEACTQNFAAVDTPLIALLNWMNFFGSIIMIIVNVLFYYLVRVQIMSPASLESGTKEDKAKRDNEYRIQTKNFVLFFFFLVGMIPYTIATGINIIQQIRAPVILGELFVNLFLLGSIVSPIILYFTDPLVKSSCDQMFGINKMLAKK